MHTPGTYFYEGETRIASHEELLPIPLREGMKITIHGLEGEYEVEDWSYHHGHEDEEAGLRISLKRIAKHSVDIATMRIP